MSKSVTIDPDEFDELLEGARFVSGMLSFMEAALSTDQGREMLQNSNVEWVLMDVTHRMDRVVKYLEEHT